MTSKASGVSVVVVVAAIFELTKERDNGLRLRAVFLWLTAMMAAAA